MSPLHILIVEDEAMIALGLELAALDLGAIVAGSVGSAAAAMLLLDSTRIDAAILDANLEDGEASPVAERLMAQSTPFIFHSATGIPAALRAGYPDLTIVRKPARPEWVLSRLFEEIAGAQH
ncbi:response regulator [Sphingomonas sp. AR_OL41]|jgi:DNA-binding response OmpR family regulator|uniref:response regulator n=1 Tax=Sphingomonas sp. AR_OL41 TaxID=3042729 RepID=UPI002480CD58|nr:response regulator [Sphingomonas sp. AR_OL41]MDH7972405.1 response regulator [Sphingomonas sp. AR_OL41]